MDNYTVNDKQGMLCSSFLLRLFTVLVLSLFAPKLFAQLDYIHYVPPLYNGSSNSGDIGTHVAVITTNSESLIDVDIFKGGADVAFITIQVSKSAPYRYQFRTTNDNATGTISSPTVYDFPYGVIGPNKLNQILTEDGLKFRSYDEPIYVNIRHVSSVQGGSLTTKGRFALGKEFRSGHVYTDNAYKATSRRSHFISVMATEDGTKVNISDLKSGILTDYNVPTDYSFDVPASNALPEITLNKGQSYVIAIDHDLPKIDGNKINDMNGTHILADKDIVVNTGSWTAGPNDGQDMGIDQIVPYDQIRDQYVVMQGQGDGRTERPIVVATVDDTYVYVNGSGAAINPSSPLSAGEHLVIPESFYTDPDGKGIPTMFIDTDEKNVYVYQTMSGSASTIGPTVGMNFIAPLAATGMHQVDVPYSGELAKKGVTAVVTILAQNGAEINYSVDGGASTLLNESNATSIQGAPEWKSYKILNVDGHLSFQADKAINVAWTVQSGYIGSAGYYSGFSKAIPKITPEVNIETDLDIICESYNDYIEVGFVSTPEPDFYEWYRNEVTEDSLIFESEKLKELAPDVPTKYILKAYYRDPALNINTNANFNSGQVVFTTGFDLSEGNMQDPGTYGISTTPKVENTNFIDVNPEEGREKMLIVYSDGQSKDIYKKEDMPIDRNTNYIISVVGRMAQELKPQLIDVYINEEKIKSNFLLDDVSKWQSVDMLWKSKDNQKATIKLVDANASGVSGVFAIDTVAFAISVEEEGEFNALVVPNYSFTPHAPTHICKEESGDIDISNGDTSWYNYEWKRKDGENYIPVAETNVTGLDSHILGFTNIADNNAGIYQCTITFKEEFQQCGSSVEPAHLEVEVIVDELARIVSLTGEKDICQGESVPLEVNVEGKFSRIAWSVNGVEISEGNVFDFNLDKSNGAGVYTIRCDVENACAPLSQELQIEIFGNPNLTGLQVPTDLCHSDEVTLTALGSFPAGATMEFSWYTDKSILPFSTSSVNTQLITPDITDSYYKVSVSAQYDVGSGLTHTCPGNEKIVNLSATDIYPQVVLTDLVPVTLCEGEAYLYSADLETSGNYYTYLWETPAAVGGNKSNPDLSLTDITTAMAGNYKVTVSNRCGTANSTSVLSVTPKMDARDITIDNVGPYCSGDLVKFTIDADDANHYKAENITIGQEQIIDPILSPFTLTANTANEGIWNITAIGNCGTTYQESFTIDVLENFSDPSLSDITTCFGEDARFEVQIETIPSGSELTYTWTVPVGSPIVDSGTAILDIIDVQADELGLYSCLIENKCGYSKTVAANLNIQSVTSALKPNPVEVCQGTLNHSFNITYVGTPTFEWRFNNPAGTVIGTLDSYTIPTVELANAGVYYCDITLACGSVLKYQQELIVNDHISISADPASILDICEGEQTELIVNITGTPNSIKWFDNGGTELVAHEGKTRISTGILNSAGILNYKCVLAGDCENPEASFVVTVHDKPSLNPIADINACVGDIPLIMTVVGTDYKDPQWWNSDESVKLEDGLNHTIIGATYPASSGNYIAKISSDYCGEVTTIAKVSVYEPITVLAKSESNPTPCIGEPLSLFVNGDGDGGGLSYRWYKDGLILPVQAVENILDLGVADLTDEATYRCELVSGNGCANVDVIFGVDVREHAKVTLQPLPQTPCDDASAIFTVTGTAEDSPSYQWFSNNVQISDSPDFAGTATGTLTVSNVVGHNADLFHCKVSGDFCEYAESDKVSLDVIQDISITNHPVSQTIDENGSVTFSVVATGGGTITYQWYENGVSMDATPASAQTASLNLSNIPYSYDGNTYYCKVTNSCDFKDSNPATLNVNIDNRITVQAVNAEACEGSSFIFTVDYKATATGCVWEYDDGSGYSDASGIGGVVSGGTSSTLTVTTATTAMETDSWKFRARVQRTGYVDNVSNPVSVKVFEQVVFTDIADATLCPNVGESFNVNITAGTGPFTYEWKRGATNLGSGSSLNLDAVSAIDGAYTVEVSNNVCDPVPDGFNITHHPDLVLTDIAHASPLCIGDDISLSALLTEGPAPGVTYTWTKDGTDLLEPSNTYGKLNVTTGESGIYKVVVADVCNSKTSSVSINVLDAISLAAVSLPVQTICEGEPVDIQVNGTGDNLVYTWYKIDALLGAVVGGVLSNDKDYHLDALTSIGANYYRCVLSSTPNCNTSVQEFTVNVQEDIELDPLAPITICEDLGSSNFTVTVTKGVPVSYQWFDNDVLMPGKTLASLSVDNILINSGHNYHCVVVGACKDAESNKALFTVEENVSITTQPVSVSVSDLAIDPVYFSVDANGSGLNYQWYKNGVDMVNTPASAQTKTLEVLAADFTSGDSYYCKVNGNCATVDSDPATLTINVTDKITSQPHNIEICEDLSFDFEVKYKIAAAGVWVYDDDNDDVYDPIPGSVGTQAVSDDGTIKTNVLTVLDSDLAMNNWKFKLIIDGGPEESSVARVNVFQKITFATISDVTLCPNTGETFNVNITTGTGPFDYTWTRVASGDNLGDLSSLTLSDVEAVGETYNVNVSNSICPDVDQDFNIAHHPDLVLTDIAHANPLCIGGDINLSAVLTEGPAPGVSYAWTKDGGAIGIDDPTYSDLGINTTESGIYKVVVADVCTSKTSSVSINVLDAISLAAVSPASQTICEGESVDLQVNGTGDNLVYNWYKVDAIGGTIVGGSLSTDKDYHIASLTTTGANYYRCVLSSTPDCTRPDQDFTVTVQEDVSVSDPASITLCENGSTSSFSVTASGEGPLTYQWYNNAGLMAGKTGTSIDVDNILTNSDQNYYCIVSGACKSDESNKALFTVNENVIITSHPDDITIDERGDATFTVDATGTGLTYQWYENGVSLGSTPVSAQTKTLTLTSVPFANNGYTYKCVVTGTCLDDESDPATVTVIKENRILVHAESTEVCEGNPFTFRVDYKNTTDDCVWEYDDDNDGIYNAIGGLGTIDNSDPSYSELTITTATNVMNSWEFRAVVKRTNYENNVSNDVSVRVDIPATFDPIASEVLCNGDGASFIVDNLSGSIPNTYQWTEGVRNLGTNSSLNLIAADATDGTYSIGVTAGVCPATVKTFSISHHDDLVLDDLIHATELCPTDDISLNAVLSSGPAIAATYSWTKDDVDLVEATATYSKSNVTDTESGLYKVTVEDHCMTQSKSINIDILDELVATGVWTNQSLCVGDELLLEAKVTGDNPTYSWTVPVGVTNPGNVVSIKVDAVTGVNEGTYICVVSGSCGTSITYTTNILVNDVPNITAGIEGLGAVCVNEPLSLGPIAYDATRGESIIWKFNDLVKPGETNPNLDLANADLIEEGNYRVEVTNACGTDFSIGFQDVQPIPTLDAIDNQIACQGEDVIFRAVTTGEDLTYRWFLDGAPQAAFDDIAELEIANVLSGSLFTSRVYDVECRVSSCGTNLSELASVTVNPNTILNKSLKGEVVYVGTDHEFDLDVTGGNLVFEWTHIKTDGTSVPLGETTKTLTLNNLSLANAGEYTCKITGDCGVRFTSGYLTVKDPLKVVEGLNTLANIEKCFGEPLNLNISVEGEVFSIDWYKGTTDLGHHELNYSIPALDISDAGLYRCEIVGEGASSSQSVNVIVYKTTVLNADLVDETLCENENLSWTPDVTGSELVYDWKYGGATVSTDATLSISTLPLAASGTYSVDITGKCGSVSTEADLSVNELPRFDSKSNDLEKCENDAEAIFTVSYTGDNLVYQWQKDGVDIAGANSPELKLLNLRTTDAGVYKCVVSSTCGVAPGDHVMNLIVIPQLKILSESPGMEICDGENAQFIIDVEGTDEVFQWQKDGVAISGENAPQLTINPASLVEDGYYSCEVSDKCTAKRYSNSKRLKVNSLPNSEIFGRMTLCVLEDRVAYNTSIQPDINYGWLVDGGAFTTPAEDVVKTKITWGDVDLNGKVKLKILNESTGCYSEIDSLVTLHALPDVTLSTLESRGICEPEFDLGGGLPEGGIYWVNGVAQNTFDPAQGNGEYQVRYSYTDDLGCSNSTSETTMTIDSLPVVKLIEDIVVGSCGSTLLSANTEENNIRWAPSRFLDDPNSETPTFTAGETTLYVATVVDKNGCVGNDIVNVTVAPLPLITTINDTIIGECKEIELTTHISGDIEEINWSNADDLDNPTNSNPKLIKRKVGVNDYQINVTDKYGCIGSESIRVEVLPNPEIGESQFICEGESIVIDTKDLSNPIWTDGYTAWERVIDKPGEYELTVEQHDCELKQRIVMNPLPEFKLDNTIQPGIVIFEGQTIVLDPDLNPDYGPYVYDWSDGSVLPQLEVGETNTYKLKVVDNIGCVATDSVDVVVKPIGIESPNAFTPLSKNENDRFYLKDINITDKFEMYIYNRWGELLYKTNEAGYANGWDGTYKGEDCPVGAYVWVVMLDGKVKEKGNVILVR